MTPNIAILTQYAHLLPPQAQEIIRLIGLPRTLALVDALGGTTFPVPHRRKDNGVQGKLRFTLLSQAVGEKAAQTLTQAYGAVRLYVPNCKHALRRIRNLIMLKEFDKRIKAGEGASDIIFDFAIRHRLTDRVIWNIVNKQTAEEKTVQQATPAQSTAHARV